MNEMPLILAISETPLLVEALAQDLAATKQRSLRRSTCPSCTSSSNGVRFAHTAPTAGTSFRIPTSRLQRFATCCSASSPPQ
jgi:hypothetical protein